MLPEKLRYDTSFKHTPISDKINVKKDVLEAIKYDNFNLDNIHELQV